jgi:hypothetical protein
VLKIHSRDLQSFLLVVCNTKKISLLGSSLIMNCKRKERVIGICEYPSATPNKVTSSFNHHSHHRLHIPPALDQIFLLIDRDPFWIVRKTNKRTIV